MAYWVSGGSDQAALPDEGLHDGVLCDVVGLGLQTNGFGETRPTVKLRWQLEAINPHTGKRFIVSQRYTESLHKKAKLSQHLETWRGRKFSEAERERFDLERLLGVNAQVQIVHNVGKDGTRYANVNAVLPPSKNPETRKPWWDRLLVEEYEREAVRAAASRDADVDPFGGDRLDADEDADEVPF